MGRKKKYRIIIPAKVREHLVVHFQQDLPGSKFYSNSPDELLAEALCLFPETLREAKPAGFTGYSGRVLGQSRFHRTITVYVL